MIGAGGGVSFSSDIGSISRGVLVLSAASANTMGPVTELIASTPHHAFESKINLMIFDFAGGAPAAFMMDILIGSPGNEEIFLEGLIFDSDNATATMSQGSWPCVKSIPKGSRVSVQLQTNLADADGVYVLMNFTSTTFESGSGFGHCESIGFDKSTTNGIAVDPGGTGNNKGAWVEITPACSGCEAFFLSIGTNLNNGQDTHPFLFDIGVGAAGDEQVLVENIPHFSTSSERTWTPAGLFRTRIPSGQRIAVRSQTSETNSTDRVRSIVFHGFR